METPTNGTRSWPVAAPKGPCMQRSPDTQYTHIGMVAGGFKEDYTNVGRAQGKEEHRDPEGGGRAATRTQGYWTRGGGCLQTGSGQEGAASKRPTVSSPSLPHRAPRGLNSTGTSGHEYMDAALGPAAEGESRAESRAVNLAEQRESL